MVESEVRNVVEQALDVLAILNMLRNEIGNAKSIVLGELKEERALILLKDNDIIHIEDYMLAALEKLNMANLQLINIEYEASKIIESNEVPRELEVIPLAVKKHRKTCEEILKDLDRLLNFLAELETKEEYIEKIEKGNGDITKIIVLNDKGRETLIKKTTTIAGKVRLWYEGLKELHIMARKLETVIQPS